MPSSEDGRPFSITRASTSLTRAPATETLASCTFAARALPLAVETS